jgi:hypothetical protein
MFVPLRALRFRAQSSVAQEAFPQFFWAFSHIGRLPVARLGALLEPNPALSVSAVDALTDEAGVKSELQKVRALAEARIKSGSVPDWSWPHHVQLIEAVDAMLHDISMAENVHHAKRYTGSPLRLVAVNPVTPATQRKRGSMH